MTRAFSYGLVVTCWLGTVAYAQDPPATTPTPDERLKEEQIKELQLKNDEQARATAEAKRKALVDALPTSPTTGAVTAKEGAGQAEAYALAASAVTSLAQAIAHDAASAASAAASGATGSASLPYRCDALGPSIGVAPAPAPAPPAIAGGQQPTSAPPPVPVLLVSGTDTLSFGRWDQFRFRACKIAEDYNSETIAMRAAAAKARADSERQAGGSLMAVGTAISAAVKFAQLVTPDWEVAPLKADVSNRILLIEVAKAYRGIPSAGPLYWQAGAGQLNGGRPIFAALEELTELNKKAEDVLPALDPYIKAGQENLKKLNPKDGLEAKVKKWTDQKSALSTVIAQHAQLLKDLYGGDAASPMPFPMVANEAASSALLGDKGLVLNVNVDSSGGTSVSRKALWNVFEPGSPPLFITGTIAISYSIAKPTTQELVGVGTFRCSTGPVRLTRVASAVNRRGTIDCPPGRRP